MLSIYIKHRKITLGSFLWWYHILPMTLVLFCIPSIYAQDRVRSMIIDIAKGKESSVQNQLKKIDPQISSRDPGILFVRALLEKNAVESVTLLENIVRQSPSSDWADDAQWRIVQIYAMKKDTNRAHEELQRMEKQFPSSSFINEAHTTVEFMVGVESGTVRASTKKINDGTTSSAIAHSSPRKTDGESHTTPKKSEEFILPFRVENGKIVSNKQNTGLAEEKSSATAAQEKKEKKNERKSDEEKKTTAEKSRTEKNDITEEKSAKHDTHPTDTKKKSAPEPVGAFTMQVGVFKSEDVAKAEQAKYTRMRMRSTIFPKEIAGENMYAVLVGNYATKDEAEAQRRLVQRVCNCPAFIVQK